MTNKAISDKSFLFHVSVDGEIRSYRLLSDSYKNLTGLLQLMAKGMFGNN